MTTVTALVCCISLTFTIISASLDDPIIMERPMHRVDWEEVMLDYEVSLAPQRNITVDAELKVSSFRSIYTEGCIQVIYDLVKKWPEPRLHIPENTIISIPSAVHLWQPKIILQNAINDSVSMSSMYYSNGLMHLNERRMAFVVKDHPYPLMLRVFEDGSAESILLNATVKAEKLMEWKSNDSLGWTSEY